MSASPKWRWLNILWQREVFDRSREIDPGDNEDWRSLAIGWAIAKGVTMNEMEDFLENIPR